MERKASALNQAEVLDDDGLSHPLIADMLAMDGNSECADCHAPHPTWASTNLGIVICFACSGVHRSLLLNIHIRVHTLVRTDEMVAAMAKQGNIRSNTVYECNVPEGYVRLEPGSTREEREFFIKSKYVDTLFVKGNQTPALSDSARSDVIRNLCVKNAKAMDKGGKGMHEYKGTVLVTVKSGSDLKSSDVNGKSDPYCKLRMGVQTHLTKEEELFIDVYDWDRFTSDDFLGKASTIVRINQDEDVTLKLQKGTILIHVKFIELQH